MITMSSLGKYGFFGNQLFQYAFLYYFCEKNGFDFGTPKWVGQEIFKNINESPICGSQTRLKEDDIPTVDNVDIMGYFQKEIHLQYYTRNMAKEIFQFASEIENTLYEHQPKEDFYIACHIRRGDYAQKFSHVYALIDERWYIDKVEELGYHYDDILWIRESSPAVNPQLKGRFSFLQDFWNIMKAPIILRANSTFSWWAATLSDHNEIYSPLVENKKGWHKVTPFVHGNWPAMVHNNDVYLEGNP